MKTIWKAQFEDRTEYFFNEIEILLQINNDNVIKCHKVFEDNNCIHFVLDLIEGGDLFDYLMSCPGNAISENRTQEFTYQILDGLNYIHNKNIVHRDIKPENYLICHSNNQLKIKLIDFGFAGIIKEGKKLTDSVGSLQYISPEMLKGQEYDTKVDIWAAGIVMYNMLTGKQPFYGKTDEELVKNILSFEPKYEDEIFVHNPCVKSLCKSLLEKDPTKRVSAGEALSSLWMQSYLGLNMAPTVQFKFEPRKENIKNILNFLNQKLNVKKTILNLLLTYLDIKQAEELKLLIQEDLVKKENLSAYSIQSKDYITYEDLLKYIISLPNGVEELNIKLNGM